MDAGDRPPSSSGAADDAGVHPPSTSGDAAESDSRGPRRARAGGGFSPGSARGCPARTRLSRVLGTRAPRRRLRGAWRARGRRGARVRGGDVRGGHRAAQSRARAREARVRARVPPGRRRSLPGDAGEIRSLAEALRAAARADGHPRALIVVSPPRAVVGRATRASSASASSNARARDGKTAGAAGAAGAAARSPPGDAGVCADAERVALRLHRPGSLEVFVLRHGVLYGEGEFADGFLGVMRARRGKGGASPCLARATTSCGSATPASWRRASCGSPPGLCSGWSCGATARSQGLRVRAFESGPTRMTRRKRRRAKPRKAEGRVWRNLRNLRSRLRRRHLRRPGCSACATRTGKQTRLR